MIEVHFTVDYHIVIFGLSFFLVLLVLAKFIVESAKDKDWDDTFEKVVAVIIALLIISTMMYDTYFLK